MIKEEPKKTPPKTKGRQPNTRAAHKKVFDVVPPGKSVAPPNSRSVIVGHKPPVKDDQFVPGGPKNSDISNDPGVGATAASTAKTDVATTDLATKTDAHSRMASDPSEKRPLMGGHKKIDLEPTPSATDSEDDGAKAPATAPDAGSSALSGAPGAPELKRGVSSAQATPPAQRPSPATNVPAAPAPDNTKNSVGGAPLLDSSASEHLADLAVEQTVDTATLDNIEHDNGRMNNNTAMDQQARVLDQPISGETSEPTDRGYSQVSQSASGSVGAASNRPATVDNLLAETGPPDIAPHPQQAVVSHHRHRGGALRVILVTLLILILSAAALNFLLDAEVIKTSLDLPYTDLIK